MKALRKSLCILLTAATVFTVASCGGVSMEESVKGSDVPASAEDSEKIEDGFVNYVDPDEAVYKFGQAETITPYFLGNVIYNETVLLEDDGDTISGKLQYAPVKILSVRDYTWKKEFSAEDYSCEGNVLTAKRGSEIPYLTTKNLQGDEIPEPFRQVSTISNLLTDFVMMGGTIYTESPLLYGHQVSVSYVYDLHDLKKEEFASYQTSGMPKLKEKLKNGEDVKIVVTGDSVAEGCSSSKKFNHEPFMDCWADLFKQGLEEKYAGNIVLDNQAVGGKTSTWGCAAPQLSKIKAASPDVVFIHFGINDLGERASANGFKENIEEMILDVQAVLPDCEFVIIKAFPPSPVAYDWSALAKYWRKMDDLANSIDNVYTIDMFTPGTTMLSVKKYMDVTGNGINHVNDFSSRLYVMNLLAALVEY